MSLEEKIEKEIDQLETNISKFEEPNKKLDQKIRIFTYCAWGLLIFGIVIAVLGLILFCFFNDKFFEEFQLNLLGDFYAGSVGSIWSLSGLIFIYIAFLGQKQQLLIQQNELQNSRIEVKYTRLQLEGQKKEMIEQNKTMKLQRFENTFFQLLRNHLDIVSGIDVRKSRQGKPNTIDQGKNCFESFYEGIKYNNKVNEKSDLQTTIEVYMFFYRMLQSDLGHYFRHLYHILKFIDTSNEIEEAEKFKYASLVRALLSSYELSMLFYNCLSENDYEKFKPLVEKYSFLKNLDRNILINTEHIKEYDEIAFASSSQRQEIINKRKIADNNSLNGMWETKI